MSRSSPSGGATRQGRAPMPDSSVDRLRGLAGGRGSTSSLDQSRPIATAEDDLSHRASSYNTITCGASLLEVFLSYSSHSLPLELRSLPRDFSSLFYSLIKTFLLPDLDWERC